MRRDTRGWAGQGSSSKIRRATQLMGGKKRVLALNVALKEILDIPCSNSISETF